MDLFRHYRQVWAVDFEFAAPPGGRPAPLCVVARELRTGRLLRLWLDGTTPPTRPPYQIDSGALFIAYYASAELGCHLELGWPMPTRILDLYAEFRCLTSGRTVPCGNGLLGGLAYFGIDGLAAAEKETMRQLALRGGPYLEHERTALLDYCQSDVDALARLLPAMEPHLDLPRGLLRGRYMAAVARMEWRGVPMDVDALERLRAGWEGIKGKLVAAVNSRYGVFEPVGRRTINPDSVLGAALLATAQEWDIDVQALADAVDFIWQQDRAVIDSEAAALRAARQATGLDHRRIDKWERSGYDYSTWPGLDDVSRELAGQFPELGIGRGYDPDAPDQDDTADRLWDKLRQPAAPTRPKYDPDILRSAAELVAANDGTTTTETGPMRFSAARWAGYLTRRGIAWPQLESGALALDDNTFKEMARAYPDDVGPIRELRHALSQLRLQELAVGPDGRNRCLLSVFASRTGRNQPSNSKFIFGPSTWLRSLIQPGPGRAVAYVDWSQQELAIAAALSGDRRMQDAYRSGDFYLTFAKMAGAVPSDATKKSHAAERDQFKTVALGVLYGLSADGLARKLAVPPCRGRDLLRMHQETFRQFWQWSDAVQDEAMLTSRLQTVFGWTVCVGPDANPRSLRNFPMQANGAEMMRLACCLATERGIGVCCPVHDALLVEGPVDSIEDVVARTQDAMQEASEIVLPGFSLRTDAKIVRHPDRFFDERGRRMWETVLGLLADVGEPADTCSEVIGVGIAE